MRLELTPNNNDFCCGTFKQRQPDEERTQKVRQLTINIDGITCRSCPVIIKSYLKRMEGVISADVNFETMRDNLIYDSRWTTKEDVLGSKIFFLLRGRNSQKYGCPNKKWRKRVSDGFKLLNTIKNILQRYAIPNEISKLLEGALFMGENANGLLKNLLGVSIVV